MSAKARKKTTASRKGADTKDEATPQSMALMLQEYRNACNAWRQAEDEIDDAMSRLNPYWYLVAKMEDLRRIQWHVTEDVFPKLHPGNKYPPSFRKLLKADAASRRKWEHTFEHPSGEVVVIDHQPGRALANILLEIIEQKPDKYGRVKLRPEYAELWNENPGFAKRWAEVHPPKGAGLPVNPAIAGLVRKAYHLATEHACFLMNGMKETGDGKIQFLRWPDTHGVDKFATMSVTKDELARCRRLVSFMAKFVAAPCDAPDVPMLDGKYAKAQIKHFDEFWQMVVEPTAKAEWKAAQRHLHKGNGQFSDEVMKRFGLNWAEYCQRGTVKDRRPWSDKIRRTMKRSLKQFLLSFGS
jgi:hypothetical protein